MIQKSGYADYNESAGAIRAALGDGFDAAVILGSGLSDFAEALGEKKVLKYADIPHFPLSTVSYQKGELLAGTLHGKKILAMNGRFHYYEGWEMWQTAYPVFVMKLLGIDTLIISNAAGGIADGLSPGDIVCVRDHIKLTADSPLRGPNIPEFGERFFDMQRVYDQKLAQLAHAAAEAAGFALREGVYAYMGGPQYETPAEIRMLKLLGAHVVGMSTVPEVIAAAQCGIRVLCLSCVSNLAAGITGAAITEEEVLQTGKVVFGRFGALLSGVIARL